MSFTFPNPLVTTEFTAANGITYLWDDDSEGPGKWVVKSFLHEGVLVDLSPIPPTRPDRPGGPNDGDLWFDTSPEELTLYVYSEDSGAWIPAAPPTTLEGRVAENEALQIQIVQRLQANDVLTNFHSSEIVSIKGDLTTIQNEIIELEEEIDAIAPSVERGKWRFTAVGTVAQPGQFTMYDADFGSGNPTGLFKSAKSIWFNEIDADGVSHGFADIDDGELLEIFVDGSPEFGLYEVKGKAHDETEGATSFWVIDVEFIRTNEDTTSVAPSELCRFKVFHAPSGGAAGDFVMKTGDSMEGPGPLVIKTTKTSSNVSGPPSNTAYIKFENNSNGTIKNSAMYIAGGTVGRLCVNSAFQSRGDIYSSGYFLAHNGSDTYDAKIYLNNTSGNLRYNNTNQLTWKSDGITELRAKNNNGDKGMVFKRTRDSTNQPQWQGVVDIGTSGTDRCVGELWYNANDGVLYLKVS